MHIGRTTGPDTGRPMLELETGSDGAISADGRVRGCYLHGLFGKDPFRHAFLSRLRDRSVSGVAYEEELEQVLDSLADHLEAHLDLKRILEMAGVR
jgi:adenosylcobyric acid synthase